MDCGLFALCVLAIATGATFTFYIGSSMYTIMLLPVTIMKSLIVILSVGLFYAVRK